MALSPDEQLFKRSPKAVKKLNLAANKVFRSQQRYAWATANPNNPRVLGKKLTKPI